MPLTINPISAPSPILPSQGITAGPKENSFQNVLSSAVANVAAASDNADAAAQNFLSGGTQELHSTILASQTAELDFELLMQVRNKVVSAYEEIMKMQI